MVNFGYIIETKGNIMALEMKQVHIPMDITVNTKEREHGTAIFSAKVQKAEAMLKGFNIRYTNGDHHVLEQEIDLDIVRIQGNAVEIAADFLIRDSSGRIDDPYTGWVQAVVVADTAANPQT